MKTSIEFLPTIKQRELHKIVQTIRQYPDIEIIILYGSYAKGNWVEEEYVEDGVHFQYQSDYDLLIVINNRSIHHQHDLEADIIEDTGNLREIRTPVSPIVHDIEYINRHLEKAQYFFSDIKKEGIVLYDSGKWKLNEPRELTNNERYQLAAEDFEYWFSKAKKFFKGFGFYLNNKDYNEAAFLLHQATEQLYTTLLLVFTRYRPKTHDLDTLRRLTNIVDQRLIKIFPQNHVEKRKRFTKLCEAYVGARYKKTYTISEEDIAWLSQSVKELQQLTEILCQEKVQSFLKE